MKRMRSVWAGLVMAGGLALAPMPVIAAQQASGAATTAAAATMPLDQLLPMTVHEAWVASGRNEDKFFAMVAELAQLSAQKRGVTLPDTVSAGQRAGATFKEVARRDPDQLLYVAVDTMVRRVAVKQAGTTPATQAGKPTAK